MHLIWHSHRGRRRNHLWQIFWWSVEGCRFCGGSKIALPHWQSQWPLTQGWRYRAACDRMWPTEWYHYRWYWMTLKINFAVWNISNSHTSGNTAYIIYDMFTHESKSSHHHVVCNVNCLFVNEGLLKVTASHVHCKCGNISETVQDGVVVTTDH